MDNIKVDNNQIEEDISINEIINNDYFKKSLENKIFQYNTRPLLESGYKYKRTPYDNLKDKGLFNVFDLTRLFVHIVNNDKVDNSKSERDAIVSLCLKCAGYTYKYLKGHGKEKESRS